MNCQNLKKFRENKGYTLAKLGTMSNLSTTYIFDLENGGRKNPSLVTLTKLAKALDCKVDELIKEDD
ncbi:hypothetical protein SDC9_202274 [bioreactor metagenome]|uniref:HTH cro/C1-type domain-containing protein n=1 Tax=bioreactor metagenome TaxID=1076179 RepID=A0A645J560_9ZZZZ